MRGRSSERGAARRRAAPCGGSEAGRMVSEALESALARVGDLEEGVQLGELEQRLQVVVEVGQPQLPALLADLLGERHEDAEPGAVDVAGLAEVDEELPLAPLQLVE